MPIPRDISTNSDGSICYKMGLSQGLDSPSLTLKRKFRYLFSIPSVAVDGVFNGVKTLPPRKSARPGAQLKEFDFQHISETIYYPLKVEWKTINLVLYDINCNANPVFDWLLQFYNYSATNTASTSNGTGLAQNVNNSPNSLSINLPGFKRDATLELYDGCGNIIEQWIFENAYPSSIDWGELDMDSNDIVMVDLTLRYDRASIRRNPQ